MTVSLLIYFFSQLVAIGNFTTYGGEDKHGFQVNARVR